MASQTRNAEFTTVSVTPSLRDDLRKTRDDEGFRTYEGLIRAMKSQYDPEDR